MALIIEGGISIGSVTITGEAINPTTNLVVFYDAGNSMCYSGSGVDFDVDYTGPNLNTYEQLGVLDLAGLTGGPWNSGYLTASAGNISWTSQGIASYWTLDGGDSQYIDSTFQQAGSNTLNSPIYTIVSVVRPQDFALGAIVGGNENIFAFVSTGGLNDGPALIAGNTYGEPSVVDTTTAFELDTWYCVAVTYDATSGTMKLYTNGVEVASQSGVDPITAPTGLYWGTLEGELWFTGDMAVCMTWERVLTAGEIADFADVYLSRYVDYPQTSSVIYNQPYVGGPPEVFTVPEGVYSISVVAVGAGGGGTQDEYAVPGGDTAMIRLNSNVNASTIFTGTGNTIVIDNTATPNIADVTTDGWIVTGADIVGVAPAWDLVTDVSVDGPITTITINNTINTTSGDEFSFYQAVAAAEGGYEINTYYYNQYNISPGPSDYPGGPGARALPLVTDGPYGSGGVVDWTDTYPIGGGGAGGYGIAGLAWNTDHAGEWYYDSIEGIPYHTMSFGESLLTVTGLIGSVTSNQETMVLGTEIISTAQVMYSLTIDQASGVAGYTGVGIANYNSNLQQFLGWDFNSVGLYDNGNVYINSDVVETGYPTFTTGSIVDIAVDSIVGKLWIRVDGGTWNNDAFANPTGAVNGLDISSVLTDGYPASLGASTWYNTDTDIGDEISIATSSFYTVPSGYTFIPGVPGAGGTGGDGAAYYGLTAMAGTGGAGGGGGGRSQDSGAGGGGVSLYGRFTSGSAGTFVDTDTDPAGIALGGGGGDSPFSEAPGGQATPWNGGRGGFPGGAGGSATGYWVAGNGGAMAYRNNYAVTPGDEYIISPGLGGLGQNNGGSGADGAIRIVWPGDTRQFPTTNVGPDEVAVPTLDITAHNFPNFSTTGSLNWTISNNGGATVLETGVVWGLPGQATYLDSVNICDGSSSTAQRSAILVGGSCGGDFVTGLTGAQTLNFNVAGFDNEEIQVRAYARNEAGVAYSATTLTWTPVICLAEGTLITLADGSTKTIESIEMSDLIKVWDFDTAVTASATPLWIKKKESTIQYNLIKFSDGSELKTIGQHRIFNKQAGKFTYPMTDATPVGTITVKSDGSEVTVTSKQVVYEPVNYYNVITSGGYLNLYANSILTSMRYNNIYPIADMSYVKDGRTLRDRSEFAGIAERWIDGLRLPEQTIDIKYIKKYVARLENNEAKEITTPERPAWHK